MQRNRRELWASPPRPTGVPSCVLSGAGAADSPTLLRPSGVLLIVRVTFRAMGLSGVSGGKAFASQHVLASRYWLKVCRVDTPAVAAEVVDRQPIGDRPNVQFIRPTVGQPDGLPVLAVTVVAESPRPPPAFTIWRPPIRKQLRRGLLWGRLRGAPVATALKAVASTASPAGVPLVIRVALGAMRSLALCSGHE